MTSERERMIEALRPLKASWHDEHVMTVGAADWSDYQMSRMLDVLLALPDPVRQAAREVVEAFDAYQPGGGLRLPNGAVRYAKALVDLRAALDEKEAV